MLKNKIFRRLALLVSLIVLLVSTANTTFGFIVTKTERLVNTFVPTVSDIDGGEVNIVVNKTVKNTGVSSISPAGFEFVLENTVSGENQTVKSDENGNAVFKLLFTATEVGKTYTYKLFETNDGMNGVTYDTTVYDISVFIDIDANDELITTVTVNGEVVENIIAEFENIYHNEHPVAPPTGDNSNITFWFIIMIISGTTSIVIMIIECREINRISRQSR